MIFAYASYKKDNPYNSGTILEIQENRNIRPSDFIDFTTKVEFDTEAEFEEFSKSNPDFMYLIRTVSSSSVFDKLPYSLGDEEVVKFDLSKWLVDNKGIEFDRILSANKYVTRAYLAYSNPPTSESVNIELKLGDFLTDNDALIFEQTDPLFVKWVPDNAPVGSSSAKSSIQFDSSWIKNEQSKQEQV